MEYRILAPEEYGRLAGLGPFAVHDVPSPQGSLVAVAEEDGEIVGYWCALNVIHAEPVWVSGGPLTAIGLMKTLYEELERRGVRGTYVFAPNDTVADLLRRAGFREREGWRVFEGVI